MRALANDPPLILADETTANLDAKTGRVIVATHVSAVAGAADLILNMEASQIIREHTLKGARLAS
jgi:ABC-type methionine transport system ATPase subunit